jgi:predicted PurR-regulated permease PerM
MGGELGHTLVHIIIGMVIGGMVSLREALPAGESGPLAREIGERAARLGEAFRRVVFAQMRISALNTFFTAFYLLAVLPLFDVHLPYAKTLVAVTLIAGLLPVVGNLISNTVIVIVSLSVSLTLALVSLGFLIVIHKLEYFLNARIVGSSIHAAAWELLVAMLVMEAAFGLPGLVAAPVYYAYLKDELAARGLV